MTRALLALALSLAAAGCSSPCLDIQELLCSCEGQTQLERDTCTNAARDQEELDPPSNAELLVCEGLLPRCADQLARGCEFLETTEGRRACGIAMD